MEAKTRLCAFVFIFFCRAAWPQVETGTVIWVDFEKDEITIAADSRSTHAQDGSHDDTECKLSAFGDKFIFGLAGMARKRGPDGWDSHLIARQIWKAEAPKETDATKLVRSVSDGWASAMDSIYGNPEIIRAKRRDQPDNAVLANSLFAATDATGKLATYGVDISFDIPLFDSTGAVKLIHSPNDAIQKVGFGSGLGLDEIILEFTSRSTPRAAEFMRWWLPQISRLKPSDWRAAFTSKLIELSILLHPRHDELGFPVDVVQLQAENRSALGLEQQNVPRHRQKQHT